MMLKKLIIFIMMGSLFYLTGCATKEQNLISIEYKKEKEHFSTIIRYNKKAINKKNLKEPIEDNVFVESPYFQQAKKLNLKELYYSYLVGNRYHYKHPFIEKDTVLFFDSSFYGKKMANNTINIDADYSTRLYANHTLIPQHYIFVDKSVINNLIYPHFKKNKLDYNLALEFAYYHELMHGNIWQDWIEKQNIQNVKLAKEKVADISSIIAIIKFHNLNKNDSEKLINSVISFRKSSQQGKHHITYESIVGIKLFILENLDYIKTINQYSIDKFTSLYVYNFDKFGYDYANNKLLEYIIS